MPAISKAAQSRRANAIRARQSLAKQQERLSQARRWPKESAKVAELLQFFELRRVPFCAHLTIASSRFLSLIKGTLSARDVHGKKVDREDFEIGHKWERHIEEASTLPLSAGGHINFRVLESNPLYRSSECRLVVAQPDFVAEVDVEGGRKERVLIEVKSTNRPENYRSFMTGRASKQKYQLQLALQCSGISKGYLVFARGTAQTPNDSDRIEYRVIPVTRQTRFFSRHRAQILKGYACFVASLAAFPRNPTPDLVLFAFNEVLRLQSQLFPEVTFSKEDDGEARSFFNQDFRRKCRISRLVAKEEFEARGFRRSVGRPRQKGSELKAPRYRAASSKISCIRFPDPL